MVKTRPAPRPPHSNPEGPCVMDIQTLLSANCRGLMLSKAISQAAYERDMDVTDWCHAVGFDTNQLFFATCGGDRSPSDTECLQALIEAVGVEAVGRFYAAALKRHHEAINGKGGA